MNTSHSEAQHTGAATGLPNSLWAASACEAPATVPLTGDLETSIAIIGAGFTGLSAAIHLAAGGQDVTVVEATEVGFGGSGRNVGLVNAGLWVNPEEIEAELGLEQGHKLYQALDAGPDLVFSLIDKYDIRCEATRVGTLHLGHSPKGLKGLEERARQLTARGTPVELLDRQTAAEMTGTEEYYGALIDRRAGTIQPMGYARGLAHAALKEGARIFDHSPVTSLTRDEASDSWLIKTPKGSLRAGKVIMATNAYVGDLWKGLQQTFTPVNLFLNATAPLTEAQLKRVLPGKQGCWDTRDVMSFFRLDQAGRLLVGSVGKVADQGDASGFLNGWASHQLNKLFPGLFTDQEMRAQDFWNYSWSGQVAFTPEHVPRLHILAPGLLTCLGYSGRGICPGTVMGKAMAELLLGRPVEELPLPLSEPSKVFARTLVEQYYARGSDLYHIYQRLV